MMLDEIHVVDGLLSSVHLVFGGGGGPPVREGWLGA